MNLLFITVLRCDWYCFCVPGLHDWRVTLVVVSERPWLERSPLISGIVAVLGSCVAGEEGLDPMARSLCCSS